MRIFNKISKTQNLNDKSYYSQTVTIFDAKRPPYVISLSELRKSVVTFGRELNNDIVLSSRLASRRHGRFVLKNEQWMLEDTNSLNGLLYNNSYITEKEIIDGDLIRIDAQNDSVEEGVLFVFSSSELANLWCTVSILGLNCITIGSDSNCQIVLPNIEVSKCHAIISYERGFYYIVDNDSVSGVIVNGQQIRGKIRLHEKDVITVTNTKLVFTSSLISFCSFHRGMTGASDILF